MVLHFGRMRSFFRDKHSSILVYSDKETSTITLTSGDNLRVISYRGHTHYIGKVFSAYIVDGATRSQWTLIGKTDPSLPQVWTNIYRFLTSVTALFGDS
jgi:hypothetical protein